MTELIHNKLRTLTNKLDRRKTKVNKNLFGEKVSLMGKIFGCGHSNVSRPFTKGKNGYRSCLQCGARKQFNPETLETFGDFYYPPVLS